METSRLRVIRPTDEAPGTRYYSGLIRWILKITPGTSATSSDDLCVPRSLIFRSKEGERRAREGGCYFFLPYKELRELGKFVENIAEDLQAARNCRGFQMQPRYPVCVV